MAKKEFSGVNTSPVYNAIAEATQPIQGQMTIEEYDGIMPGEEEAAVGEDIAEEPTKKQYKPRRTYTAEEAEEAKDSLHTAGKKGVKLPRINLAFTPANYEFCKVMAQVRGQNLTEFINDILSTARTEHADIYNKAIEFRKSL